MTLGGYELKKDCAYMHVMYQILVCWLKKCYSKTCLKQPLKKKVLKTDGSLMQVESIAECSLGAFCNTFDLH